MNVYENPELLNSLFIYNPETGRIFHAIDKRGGNGCIVAAAGAPADSYIGNHGYRVISLKVDGKARKLLAHRVAYVLLHGMIPDGLRVDHVNRDRTDNAAVNLRLVTPQQNSHNRKALGFGRYRVNQFRARIECAGREVFLGNFSTPDAARSAYLAAKTKHHPSAPVDLLTGGAHGG